MHRFAAPRRGAVGVQPPRRGRIGPASRRATAATLLALLLAGCAGPRVLLDPRPVPAADDPDAALLERYSALADRLQATASYYDHQAVKSHNKLRAMSVLVGVAAGGAGGTIGALAQAELPDAARPSLGTVGISLAVLSGLFAVLPHAHQYSLKEASYRRQAQEARAAYVGIDARCGPALIEADDDAIGRCVADLQQSLAAARSFDASNPGRPPAERELEQMLRAAR